jgi:hypothetical protein
MFVDALRQHAAATAGRAAPVANVDAVRGRFPEASRDRLAGTNENPVLIAVLAAAFIGERTTLRRTIGLLMGIARSAGDRRGHRTDGPPRWRPRAGRLQTHVVSTPVGVGGHRVGFAVWFVMQSSGDGAPMIADDIVSASITQSAIPRSRPRPVPLPPRIRGRARPARL